MNLKSIGQVNKEPKIGKEYKEGGFRRAYYSLPHNMIREARKEICRLCYWNESSFSVKLSGSHYFRVYEIEAIEKFFAGYNLNAWTGEPINKTA